MDDFNACPFCGMPIRYEFFNDGFFDIHRITCLKCHLQMDSLSYKELLKTWNTRKDSNGIAIDQNRIK